MSPASWLALVVLILAVVWLSNQNDPDLYA